MRTVARTRTVLVVGKRARSATVDVLRRVHPGEEAAVLVLGLQPTPGQRRLSEEALAMAAERRFVLSDQLCVAVVPEGLHKRVELGFRLLALPSSGLDLVGQALELPQRRLLIEWSRFLVHRCCAVVDPVRRSSSRGRNRVKVAWILRVKGPTGRGTAAGL